MDMNSANESDPGKTNPIYRTMYESISWEKTVLPVLRNQMYREPVFDLIQGGKVTQTLGDPLSALSKAHST